MKLFVDEKPYSCEDCLFGLSKVNCSMLNKPLNEYDKDFNTICPLEECPLRGIEDIEIVTEIERGYYSDDMMKISLVLDGKELTSDTFVYGEYCGSMDD